MQFVSDMRLQVANSSNEQADIDIDLNLQEMIHELIVM